MAEFDRRYAQVGTTTTQTGVAVDEGLRSYMLGVYNYMAAGLVLTGLVAYFLFTQAVTSDPNLAAQGARGALSLKRGMFLTPLGAMLYASPLKWVIMLAPLAFVFFLAFRVYSMSVAGAQIAFWLFAAVMGVSLSTIFLVFSASSISQVFFITAATFACLSVYGYTTKKDLSGWGTFLIMGVIGLIIASLVNIFMQSPALQFAISCIGVLVFAGLTAYDTQQIKDSYYHYIGDATALGKGAIMGALNLYLDFINMFQMMLGLMGDRE
jgi:FtsH-binding integral membrane protein